MKNIFTTFLTVLLISCGSSGSDTSSGETIGYVKIEPPVTDLTPQYLRGGIETTYNRKLGKKANLILVPKSAALTSLTDFLVGTRTECGDSTGVRGYGVLFCSLFSIDERFSELDGHANNCLSNGPALNTLLIPIGTEFSQIDEYLQCGFKTDDPTRDQWIGFGKNNNKFYLHEAYQVGGFNIVGNIDLTTESVDVWIIQGSDPESPIHINADQSAEIIEMTGGFGCGFHIRANRDLNYMIYTDGDCNATPNEYQYCLGADNTELPLSQCIEAGLNVFSLKSLFRDKFDGNEITTLIKDNSFIKSLEQF